MKIVSSFFIVSILSPSPLPNKHEITQSYIASAYYLDIYLPTSLSRDEHDIIAKKVFKKTERASR